MGDINLEDLWIVSKYFYGPVLMTAQNPLGESLVPTVLQTVASCHQIVPRIVLNVHLLKLFYTEVASGCSRSKPALCHEYSYRER